jgi:hypothetical protein
MGYYLHITRKSDWWDDEGPDITSDEWLRVVDEDPELRLAGYNGAYFAIWSGPLEYADPWLDWSRGQIDTKNPDPPLIRKMLQIASRLGAKVQGDDGEVYDEAMLLEQTDTRPKNRRAVPSWRGFATLVLLPLLIGCILLGIVLLMTK